MMTNRPNTTQQINTYIRSQQLLNRQLQLLQRIKKANRTRQSNRSAFNNLAINLAINLTKVDYTNQITQGVNQYATV